ncbi:MAG TPA: hypothetical protein PLI57_08245, partial [Spirochaetota bacterium]|nr:hypothetical protein [Spirochaetota bacterium]
SRPDKSGNSRFEYTKMLNIAHAATLSGLAPLETKYPICVEFISGNGAYAAPYVSKLFDTYASISKNRRARQSLYLY